MSNQNKIIRFKEASRQESGSISRIVGFVPAKFLLPLFSRSILDANPRRPKLNKVTADILSSLSETPELFQFKSKGILIGTSTCESLQRNRFMLDFKNSSSEGILDGGHNMLSIGLHIIKPYMDEREWKKIRDWDALLDAWDTHFEEINADRDELDFLVSAELIIPANDNIDVVEEFRVASIDICAARNNNAQLAQEAKANQKGFYDEIRERLERKYPEIAKRVEWKTNLWESDDTKPIKVRDLIALAWIPLSYLDDWDLLPEKMSVAPRTIYAGKGKCSELFDKVMENPEVAKQVAGGKYEMHNPSVGSAFDLFVDLPVLYDFLLLKMDEAYNESGGNFNLLKAVKKTKSGIVLTPYTQSETEYRVPDGFIVPLFYGLKVLMRIRDDKVEWAVDPKQFLDEYLGEIMSGYKMAMQAGENDPQKIAKTDLSYEFATRQFKFCLQEFQNK